MTESIVFESFGLLEHVLSYISHEDLVNASMVSCRWKNASRSDILWIEMCKALWSDKAGMTHLNERKELPLFFRPLFSAELIDQLSVSQIRSVFSHPILKAQREEMTVCLEKSELRQYLRSYISRIAEQSTHRLLSRDLWFVNFASSVIDARRSLITNSELCSKNGFDMYFKVDEQEVFDEQDLDDLVPYVGHPGIMLYHHSICYFEPNQDFAMEMKDPGTYHPTDLQWRLEGCLVQVGPYPYLVIRRLPNWGWKLENQHVVLKRRDTRYHGEVKH